MNESKSERIEYFLFEEPYTGHHDFFYSPDKYPAIKELEANTQVIKDEITAMLQGKEQIETTVLNPPYLSSPTAWKNFYFYNFGWKKHKNCAHFPKTDALLRSIPNMTFGGLTLLEPHSKVLPHCGETNAIIRCHLGLKIPAPYPICGMKVGTEEHGWEEGKVMMFSDAHLHTAWNDSDEQRYVLVFDIIRDEYVPKKLTICAGVLGALSLKYFYTEMPAVKKLPASVIKGIHFVFKSFWYLYLPLQNRFGLP